MLEVQITTQLTLPLFGNTNDINVRLKQDRLCFVWPVKEMKHQKESCCETSGVIIKKSLFSALPLHITVAAENNSF